jgi:hypothetical protein
LPTIIEDRIVAAGGWIDRSGAKIMNLYRPPRLKLGDAGKADRWVEHFRLIYPDTAEDMIDSFAHTAQKPHEKINHSTVMGGEPGIGKDTLLEPVKYAVGPWNFGEVSPAGCFSQFNPYAKNVILRVSEARDMGDHDRFAFYEHMKVYGDRPIATYTRHRPYHLSPPIILLSMSAVAFSFSVISTAASLPAASSCCPSGRVFFASGGAAC